MTTNCLLFRTIGPVAVTSSTMAYFRCGFSLFGDVRWQNYGICARFSVVLLGQVLHQHHEGMAAQIQRLELLQKSQHKLLSARARQDPCGGPW